MNDRDIKKAAEKIRMSDELSKRIISSCENTNKIIENSDGYTDYHFVAEHVKPKRFLHTLSGIAACLVVLGGVGLTLGLLSKGSSPMTLVDDFETEETAEETTEEMTVETKFRFDLRNAELSSEFSPFYADTKLTDDIMVQITEYVNSLELTPVTDESYYTFANFIGFSSQDTSVIFGYENRVKINDSYYEYDTENAFNFFSSIFGEDSIKESICNILTVFISENIRTEYTKNGSSFIFIDENRTEYEMNTAAINTLIKQISDSEITDTDLSKSTYKGSIVVNSTNENQKITRFDIIEDDIINCVIYNPADETHNTVITIAVDTNRFIEELNSALNTEIKHTEDNAAYYLPFANFVKMGNAEYYVQSTGESGTLDDTQSIAAQDIFYGYDWAAHDVTAEEKSNRSLDSEYRFSFFVGGIDDNNTLNIGVTDDGYIIEYFMDSKGNIVHDEDTKYYKFSNTDIYDSIKALHG